MNRRSLGAKKGQTLSNYGWAAIMFVLALGCLTLWTVHILA